MAKKRDRHLPIEIEERITLDLKKKYTDHTINIYRNNIDYFSEYLSLSQKKINDANFEDIKEFLNNLKIKGRANQTRNQYYASLRYYFNDLLGENFPFHEYKIQRSYRQNRPEIIPETEIKEIIASADTFRNRLIISLTYGSGLEMNEICDLKISDINFNNRTIKIKTNQGNFLAILAESLVEDLKDYIKEEKPLKYLFESTTPGNPLTSNSIRRAFTKAQENRNSINFYKFKQLKYSFIKHLQDRGYPLISILKLTGNAKEASVYRYMELNDNGEMLRTSPLDLLFNPNKGKPNTNRLEEKIKSISDIDQKDYLMESLLCFKSGSLRAGVILAWIAATRNIQNKLLQHPIHTLNDSIQKHALNARKVRNIGDFAYILEGVQLKAACELNIIDKNEKSVLESCLDLRNNCGHPSKYRPDEYKVLAFIEDLITILFNSN